jgi:hypothetical protein
MEEFHSPVLCIRDGKVKENTTKEPNAHVFTLGVR